MVSVALAEPHTLLTVYVITDVLADVPVKLAPVTTPVLAFIVELLLFTDQDPPPSPEDVSDKDWPPQSVTGDGDITPALGDAFTVIAAAA